MPRKKAEPRREPEPAAKAAVQGMLEKKAMDPVILDFSGLGHAVCDTFVICHGSSRTQVEAIAGEVMRQVKKTTGEDPWHKEGFENAEWILIDYVSLVVHIFQDSRRKFYNLEQLWGDARIERVAAP